MLNGSFAWKRLVVCLSRTCSSHRPVFCVKGSFFVSLSPLPSAITKKIPMAFAAFSYAISKSKGSEDGGGEEEESNKEGASS